MMKSGVLVALACVIPICLLIGWVAYLVYADSMHLEHVRWFKMPALFPWSKAALLRRRRLEAAIAEEETRLFEARHTRLQKELIFEDLPAPKLHENKSLLRRLRSGWHRASSAAGRRALS